LFGKDIDGDEGRGSRGEGRKGKKKKMKEKWNKKIKKEGGWIGILKRGR
jgi:hypothetical protein